MRLIILFLIVFLLMGAKSCRDYPLKGDTVASLYPSKDLVRIRTVINSCPLKVTSATNASISSLPDGGCWIPPEQCEKYARDFESNSCQ